MHYIGEQFGFLPVTAFQRLVIAMLLLSTFTLVAAIWAAQQSSRSVCLLVADHSSDGIWLADVDRGMGATLHQPHQGISPHLFTATFSNSTVVLYVDEDSTAGIDKPHGHLAILSIEQGPLLPRIPIGSFYYPDVPEPEPNAKIYPGVSDYINFDLTPDGQHLVYAGHNADGHAFLRNVSLDGGEVITRSVDQYPILNGWSPDGHYFMTLTFDRDTTTLNVWETATLRSVRSYSVEAGGLDASWSPDSKHIAYIIETEVQSYVNILDTDDAEIVSYPVGQAGPTITIYWSPNSQAILVSSGYETLIDIAHGRVYDRSSPGAGGNYEVHWSRDGHTLILLNNDETSAGKVDFWSVYSLENSQTTTFHDILAWKANPVNADRVVIAWLEPDGKTAIDVMDMDGRNRIRLLDLGASLPRPTGDGTQIEWSPDGAWIVVPWTDPISLVTGFTLVRADGSQHYDFPAGSQWRWLLNGQELGYLISQANGQSVGILNMATGARHVLIDGPQDIRFIATPGINDLLAVWWEANDLSAHIRAYQPDGTLAYQADGASLVAAPNPSPYLAVSGQLMRSPDGKLAHVYGYSNFGSRISIAEQPMTAVVTAQNVAIRLPIEWSDNVQWSHCG